MRTIAPRAFASLPALAHTVGVDSDSLVREPVVAGILYPDHPDDLRATVRSLIAGSPVYPMQSVACLSPYAAYEYCGMTIAAAVKSLAGRPVDRVVIIGPVHRDHCERALLPESDAYALPGMTLTCDAELTELLVSMDRRIVIDDLPHLDEHAIEVVLPFVATLFPTATIVPVLAGDRSRAVAELIRRIVTASWDAGAVVICASNLTSYGERARSATEASILVDALLSGDELALDEHDRARFSSPGLAVIAGLARAARDRAPPRILHRDSSFRIDAESGSTVEYGAICYGDRDGNDPS